MHTAMHHGHGFHHGRFFGHHRLPTVFFLAICAVILVQHALYFSGFSFASIQRSGSSESAPIALVSLDDYEAVVSEFYDEPLEFTLHGSNELAAETMVLSKQDIGFSIDREQMAVDARDYDYRKSAIPLGGLFFRDEVRLSDYITIDEEKLRAFAATLHEDTKVAPAEATVTYPIGSGDPIFTPSKVGYSYKTDLIADTLKMSIYAQSDSVGLSASPVTPAVTQDFLTRHRSEIDRIYEKQVAFEYSGEIYTLAGNNELLGAIRQDAKGSVGFDDAQLAAHIARWVGPWYEVTPSPAIADRNIAAVEGLVIDGAAAVASYKQALLADDSTTLQPITVTMMPPQVPAAVQPQTHTSQQELQALVNHLGDTYDAAIAVQEFGAQERTASYAGGERRVAASTYKLAVAYAVAQQISDGTMTWGDPVNGRTTRSCMESMIVYSTNHCAEAWRYNVFGADHLNDMAASLGLGGVCFECGFYSQSSVLDQVAFMRMFYQSEGLDPEVAAVITDMLDRQKYRNGIPYAASGYNTYNKIGWVPGHYNDTAIIEMDAGPVAISIYTNSGGWGQIRGITSQLVTFLEP